MHIFVILNHMSSILLTASKREKREDQIGHDEIETKLEVGVDGS